MLTTLSAENRYNKKAKGYADKQSHGVLDTHAEEKLADELMRTELYRAVGEAEAQEKGFEQWLTENARNFSLYLVVRAYHVFR